jgi:hypothetical protein
MQWKGCVGMRLVGPAFDCGMDCHCGSGMST